MAAASVDEVARRYDLAGEVLVARGDRILLDRGYGTVAPSGGAKHKAGERWRLASITKQVTAALVARDLPPATLDSAAASVVAVRQDPAVSRDTPYPPFGDVTVRQLLQHHSGLANPNDTPAGADGVPAFYKADRSEAFSAGRYCWSRTSRGGAPFDYNNCDYLVLQRFMELSGHPLRWPAGMTMARLGELGVPGFVGGRPEPQVSLSNYGASGGLMGSVRAVWNFDRSLLRARFMPADRLAELWRPEGKGSAQALGQWVFPGQLKGCAAPHRIVQRDGEIYGVQARNYILPDDDLVVIVFTNRSADDFKLGEVWEGKGFVYDLLSAAVGC